MMFTLGYFVCLKEFHLLKMKYRSKLTPDFALKNESGLTQMIQMESPYILDETKYNMQNYNLQTTEK